MAYLESTSGAQFSNAQTITATADSTSIFDVTGAGVGSAPAMTGANGVNTAIGVDIGAADGVARPAVLISINTATTVTGTLSFTLQAAPDNGAYLQGTYYTLSATAALTGATQIGAGKQILMVVPPIPPGFAPPRFYKMKYTVGSSISVTVTANLTFNYPTVAVATLYGGNFSA